jgi:hypothetical protein
MDRITPDSRPRATGDVGAGHTPARGTPEPSTQVDRSTALHDELGRLEDLLDRVDRDRAPLVAPPPLHLDRPALASIGGGVSDMLAKHLERARFASPAASARKDPTQLPTPAECRRSFAAIAVAGFTDVHLRPVPYLNQGNGDWAKHPYPRTPPVPGEARTIAGAGCAPTALAMIDCGLRDAHTRPETMADFAVRQHRSGTSGTAGTDTAGLTRDWAAAHGLATTAGTSSDRSKNVDVLKAGLLANGIALVSVGADPVTGHAHFSTRSHVMVINGCAMRGGEEWFAVVNPGRADQTRPHDGLLATDAQVTQIKGAHHGVGQVWISRTQLEAEMKRCFVVRSGGES